MFGLSSFKRERIKSSLTPHALASTSLALGISDTIFLNAPIVYSTPFHSSYLEMDPIIIDVSVKLYFVLIDISLASSTFENISKSNPWCTFFILFKGTFS